MSSNFPNGSLVMRVWRFDGNAELIAKFQYWDDAVDFAKAKAGSDPNEHFFFLAVCDYECKTQGFGIKLEPKP